MRLRITILIAAWLLAGQAHAQSDIWNARRVASEYRPSVVFIQSKRRDNSGSSEERTFTGTGFIVTKNGYLLTSLHVIEEEGFNTLEIRGVLGSRHSSEVPQRLRVIHKDRHQDLAVLKFPDTGKVYKPIPIGNSDSVDIGAELFALGFPGPQDYMPAFGLLGNRDGENGRWINSVNYTNGMSGGPVINTSGVVVGVVYAGTLATILNELVPINHARSILAGLSIQVVDAQAVLASGYSSSEFAQAIKLAQGTKMSFPGGQSAAQSRLADFQFSRASEGQAAAPALVTQTIDAAPGRSIVGAKLIAETTGAASDLQVNVSPDGSKATVTYRLNRPGESSALPIASGGVLEVTEAPKFLADIVTQAAHRAAIK